MFAGKLRAGRPSCPIRHSQRPTPEGDWASRRKLAERSPCSASVSGIHAATTVPHLARRPLAPRKQRRRLVLGRRGSLPQERHLLPVPELPPRLLDLLLSVDTILPVVYTLGMPQKRMSVTVWVCSRCGHEWQSREDTKPICCARCKSPFWDRPRRQAVKH